MIIINIIKNIYIKTMVKNTTGGSKTKGQARKFTSGGQPKGKLRMSIDELEIYAQVTKMLGNGMCHVMCIDGETRLCHIRKKFRGRSRRDNSLTTGSWLLVGLREWELSSTNKTDKLNNCDVLEVYSENDKQNLKDNVNLDWSIFNVDDKAAAAMEHIEDDLVFEDAKTRDYRTLMEAAMETRPIKENIMDDDDEEDEVDINDI